MLELFSKSWLFTVTHSRSAVLTYQQTGMNASEEEES